MSRMLGRTLAHYKILEKNGSGDMGHGRSDGMIGRTLSHYKALDLKLNREVTFKVLPPELVSDPDRFVRSRSGSGEGRSPCS